MIEIRSEPSLAAFERHARPIFRPPSPASAFPDVLCLRLLDHVRDKRYKTHHFFEIYDRDVLVAAAGQGVPEKGPLDSLILSSGPPAAFEAMAAHVRAGGITISGINGPRASTDAFAAAWNKAAGPGTKTFKKDMDLQYYVLRHMKEAEHGQERRPVSGAARWATMSDVGLVDSWWVAFATELKMDKASQQSNPEWVAGRIQHGDVLLWEDGGQVVSMVWFGKFKTIEGMTNVGPVYTPLKFRKNGYGQACTAFVSKHILAQGDVAVLGAEIGNDTSNKIYKNIGFEETVEYQEYHLS